MLNAECRNESPIPIPNRYSNSDIGNLSDMEVSDARPRRSEIAAGFVGAHFQPSYLIFPSPGCWEITARANGSEMSFVTRVVKAF
jgi:hypothetical protein